MASAVLYGRGRREESEWLVWLTVAVALLIGLAIEIATLSRLETASAGPTSLSYPATWVKTREQGTLLAAADLDRGGIYGARVSVRQVPKTELAREEVPLIDAATRWSVMRGKNLVGYRVLDIQPTTLNGREAVNVEFAYLAAPPQGLGISELPALLHAVDTIVASGDSYFVLTFAAEASDFERLTSREFPRFLSVHQDILSRWRVP